MPSIEGERTRLFGDNDKLSALLSTHIGADLLVLLSDVDGLYDRSPSDAGARLLTEVASIDETVMAYADGVNGRGRGGMRSKLEAARLAQQTGQTVVIANGRTAQVLEQVVSGEPVGTRFPGVVGAAEMGDTRAGRGASMSHATSGPIAIAKHEAHAGAGVRRLAERARAAARVLAPVSLAQRNAALTAIAAALDEQHAAILAANAEDVHLADALVATGDLSAANRARLALTPAKLAEMSAQVRAVRDLPDPLGRTLDAMELDEGLELEKRSVRWVCWR